MAGFNVRALTRTCVYLELNARLLLQALALGEVRYLSAGEVEQASGSPGDTLGLDRAALSVE